LELNLDTTIHGIIVQMPLPDHIDKKTITSSVSIDKDVDGFHELNMGKLALAGYNPTFIPCTPR
jgi:5,10-methylene-tetrahydrofolate dehydrogenase/methenyl tetrahydrofolate cyclohydrolase